MHVLEIVIEISHSAVKVAGGDEAKGAFKANEGKEKDDVGPDGADKHNEVEDAHEQDKVSYKDTVISRFLKERRVFILSYKCWPKNLEILEPPQGL
jgi:hypothetical protein